MDPPQYPAQYLDNGYSSTSDSDGASSTATMYSPTSSSTSLESLHHVLSSEEAPRSLHHVLTIGEAPSSLHHNVTAAETEQSHSLATSMSSLTSASLDSLQQALAGADAPANMHHVLNPVGTDQHHIPEEDSQAEQHQRCSPQGAGALIYYSDSGVSADNNTNRHGSSTSTPKSGPTTPPLTLSTQLQQLTNLAAQMEAKVEHQGALSVKYFHSNWDMNLQIAAYKQEIAELQLDLAMRNLDITTKDEVIQHQERSLQMITDQLIFMNSKLADVQEQLHTARILNQDLEHSLATIWS